jgi:Acyl-CoA carboxylase epsilon subunit
VRHRSERSERTIDAASERSERTIDAVNQRGGDPAGGRSADPASAGSEQAARDRRALFRVIRGEPSDAEVAALAAVLAAVSAASTAVSSGPPTTSALDRWSDPAARLRTPLHPGPGAWRTSTWPR